MKYDYCCVMDILLGKILVRIFLFIYFFSCSINSFAEGEKILKEKYPSVLQINGNLFRMNGKPFDMWGIRTASATENKGSVKHLIDQLDDYKYYGVNSVAVYFMGSNGGSYDPFNQDGTMIDRNHLKRMKKIIEAAGKRGMVVVVGIFYQKVPLNKIRLKDWQACKNAVRTVASWLKQKEYSNVILNIANEQNSSGYIGKPWERVRDPKYLLDLCNIAKKEAPNLIVGAGGYNIENNKIIGISEKVDVLLFDTSSPSKNSGVHFDEYRRYGIFKPIVNVEMFGAWTGRFKDGNFLSNPEIDYFYDEIDVVASTEGLYTFFFAMDWLQGKGYGKKNRYDIAGEGTLTSPGIRWFFEYLKKKK